jgi:hypothetical protein
MPKPKKGEKEEQFIPRCIKMLQEEENKSHKESVGQCFGIWENHRKDNKEDNK